MQRRASAVDAIKDVKKAFLSYDADGSGEIDKDELQYLLTDLGLAQSDVAHLTQVGEDRKYDFDQFTKLYNDLAAVRGDAELKPIIHNLEC